MYGEAIDMKTALCNRLDDCDGVPSSNPGKGGKTFYLVIDRPMPMISGRNNPLINLLSLAEYFQSKFMY